MNRNTITRFIICVWVSLACPWFAVWGISALVGLGTHIFNSHLDYQRYAPHKDPSALVGLLALSYVFGSLILGVGVSRGKTLAIRVARSLLAIGIAYCLVMGMLEIYFFVLHPISHTSLRLLFLAKFIVIGAMNYFCLKYLLTVQASSVSKGISP